MADTATHPAGQTAPAIDATTAQLRRQVKCMVTELMELESLTAALKLAALQDSARGYDELHWPDLLSTLLKKIPSHENLQNQFDAIADEFVLIGMSTNTNAAAVVPSARSRANLTQTAKSTATA